MKLVPPVASAESGGRGAGELFAIVLMSMRFFESDDEVDQAGTEPRTRRARNGGVGGLGGASGLGARAARIPRVGAVRAAIGRRVRADVEVGDVDARVAHLRQKLVRAAANEIGGRGARRAHARAQLS